MHGNLFEQNWADAQVGFAIVLTPRTEDGANGWNVVEDVTFTDNIVRATNNGLNLSGQDDADPTVRSRRITLRNNLFDLVGTPPWGDGGRLFQLLSHTADVTIAHNTALQTGSIVMFDGTPHERLAVRDNVAPHNEYGVFGSGAGVGRAALTMFAPDATLVGNVFAGGASASYPAGNFFPPSLDAVGFVDRAGGQYGLAPSSMYRAMGSDMRDPGVDWAALTTAQSHRSPSPPRP